VVNVAVGQQGQTGLYPHAGTNSHLFELNEAAIWSPVLEGLGAAVSGLQQQGTQPVSMQLTNTATHPRLGRERTWRCQSFHSLLRLGP
jgi:hypothetical protein